MEFVYHNIMANCSFCNMCYVRPTFIFQDSIKLFVISYIYKMSENMYLEPLSIRSSTSSNSYLGSEEDFVDLQELPKFSRNFSTVSAH